MEQVKQDADEPKKIGYKTFPDGPAAYKYYKMLLRELTHNQDLNEVCHCKPHTLTLEQCGSRVERAAPSQIASVCRLRLQRLSDPASPVQYEHHMVVDLLKQGHPSADQKVCWPLS